MPGISCFIAPPAVSGIVMPGMLDMSCPAWGSAFGDALLPVVPDISIPGMVPIPDMSCAAALGFAAGVARLAGVGLVAGLADVLRLAGVAEGIAWMVR